MIDDNIEDILGRLFDVLNDSANPVSKEKIDSINSGQAAGFATLVLMKKSQETIKPIDIVELFKETKSRGEDVSVALYERFGTSTVNCLARGSRYLAAIWDSAWLKGNGTNNLDSLEKVDEDKLIKLYADKKELPSMHLDTIDGELNKNQNEFVNMTARNTEIITG
jgi:hypothetical protein